MTMRRGSVSGDMMGLTLTQLVVLIAFALLAATVILDQELAATVPAVEDVERLERTAAAAAADARSMARIYFGADRPAASGADPGLDASIADDLLDISRSLELFKRAVRSDDAQSMLADRTLPEIWTELAQVKAQLARSRSMAMDAQQSLGAVETVLEGFGGDGDAAAAVADILRQNRDLRIRNLRLAGQFANLERRAGNTGKPPCWVTPDGTPEYTYKITITDLDIVVEPVWRESRAADMEQVGVSASRETVRFDEEGFSRAMYPFLAFGAESDPECRFFVQVVDATGPFKGAWQNGLALVEGYFYKYWLK